MSPTLAQVSARAEARAVGMRVLRRAAAERAREETAAKERRLVSMQLHNLGEASKTFTSAPSPKGSAPSLQFMQASGIHSGFASLPSA